MLLIRGNLIHRQPYALGQRDSLIRLATLYAWRPYTLQTFVGDNPSRYNLAHAAALAPRRNLTQLTAYSIELDPTEAKVLVFLRLLGCLALRTLVRLLTQRT